MSSYKASTDEAPTLLPFMAGEPPEKPAFSTRKRKNTAGEIQNNQKDGFSGGARDSFAGAGVGAGAWRKGCNLPQS